MRAAMVRISAGVVSTGAAGRKMNQVVFEFTVSNCGSVWRSAGFTKYWMKTREPPLSREERQAQQTPPHRTKPIVLSSHAVIQPLAVVVKVCDVLVVGTTVFGPRPYVGFAQVAVKVLDDMLVLGPVKSRHEAAVTFLSQNTGVCRVHHDGDKMCEKVSRKQ
ncbi:hypothetical protein NDU88_002849 [Pleurodeles waltl]|uniref:Uncharacterized protein n=1 Tax=Pleurodeles waltl TaxID=8319 RepID=A0AAV7UWS6_PLEWA|nr:hypothetical protein NDU88_002849 [Pleurodeles waltl]